MQTHRRRPSKSILLPRASSATWAQPAHARRPSLTTLAAAENDTHLWGYALLAATAIMFMSTMYAIVGSKFMPDTGVPVSPIDRLNFFTCLYLESCLGAGLDQARRVLLPARSDHSPRGYLLHHVELDGDEVLST